MPGLIISDRLPIFPDNGLLPHIKLTSLFKNEYLDISFNGYKSYPLRKLEYGSILIFIEGYLYDLSKNEVDSDLKNIIESGNNVDEKLGKWVEARDGEFIICIIDPDKKTLIIANDIFGRLPLYSFQNKDTFFISREIAHLLDTLKPDFDKQSLAIYMLLGYSINNRTIYQDVNKVPGHSVMKINLKTKSFSQKTFSFVHDLFQSELSQISARDLKQTLKSALQRRMNVSGPCALSLSGGLDSRIIAGILKEMEIKIPALTFTLNTTGVDFDVQSSKELTGRHDISDQHTIVDCSSVSEQEVNDLANIKRGQNFVAMAFLLPFLEKFRTSGWTIITGDGGDKTLENIYPLYKIHSQKKLTEYIIKKQSIIPLSKVAKWTGISANSIRRYLSDSLQPDLSYEKQYASFLLKERGMNWLFEGEDRNRYFTWSTTPYYSPDFVRLTLAMPGSSKNFGKLFLSLLQELPGNTENIINPNWHLAPNQTGEIEKLMFRQRMKFKLPSILLRYLKSTFISSSEFLTKHPYLPGDTNFEKTPPWFKLTSFGDAGKLPVLGHWVLITLKLAFKASKQNDRQG